MPDMNLDEEGFVLTTEGNRLEIDGEPVKLNGVMTQDAFNKTLGQRLTQEREKLSTRIKALEEVANKTPAIEQALKDAKDEKTALEQQLKDAEKSAEDKVKSQLAKLQKENADYKSALTQEQSARVRDQVTTSILAASQDKFINPARDVVPHLLGAHKREPAKDNEGKTIEGQFVDVFKMKFKDEKGNEVEDFVPVDKAVGIFAGDKNNAHYVRPGGFSGAGGGSYGGKDSQEKGGLVYPSMNK